MKIPKLTIVEYLIGWTIDVFLNKSSSKKVEKLAIVHPEKGIKLNQCSKAQAKW